MVKQLESSPSIQAVAEEIAEGIAADKISPLDAMMQFCKLCEALRSGNMICEWHKSCLTVPETCDVCPQTNKKH